MLSISFPLPLFQTKAQVCDEVIVHKGNFLKMIVPKNALAPGSVQITALARSSRFSQWDQSCDKEAYHLIQRTLEAWESQGITDYMIYGKESQSSPFCWEIVPYPKGFFRFWQQLKVLWNITFGGATYSISERMELNEALMKGKPRFSTSYAPPHQATRNGISDAFCNPEVIKNQLVYEGKHMYVLYNYAPINIGEKLHFLLVPKRHSSKFSQLSSAQYIETKELSRKLQAHYRKKGIATVYQFAKTGLQAGQTVNHCHEHLVFTATKTQEFFGKLRVLKNMLLPPSPLKKEESNTRVKALKKELSKALD